MKYTLQVFTGFWHTARFQADDIIRRILLLASRMDVEQVIIGWSPDSVAYREIGAALHKAGIRMMLWLPVFSEVSGSSDPDPAMDLFGEAAAALPSHGGETFQFVCPSSPRNADIVKRIYADSFAGCGFDGVFLDRIRSQSFAAGVSGVLSCTCERCRELFHQKGVRIGDIRKRYEARKESFFNMSSWPTDGKFTAEDPLVQRFFEAKEEIIADAVTGLTRHFRNQGLAVGLDLFAPLVSRLVGQNYALITEGADFVKPMLYRRTEAPAGIGYEYALFEKYAPESRGNGKVTMDAAFLHTQLQAIEGLPCRKYPGIEINYDAAVVRTDPGYIRESLDAVREHSMDGASLCWNIMQAPEAHLLLD